MASTSYIPLAHRDIWTDVTPVPQDDGPNPLVPIMYSAEYKDAMDYFRALSVTQERSERGLELTETIIRMNPAHYTVWQFRLATLLSLQKNLSEELELMNEFARENLKSYQVWHHRLSLLTQISPQDPTFEIDYIHESLLPDPKNYHTWAYLHWLYSHFSSLGRITEEQWNDELAWCTEMLRMDSRNNSAWGWRWFLEIGRPDAPGLEDDGEGEIKYALKAIHLAPHNVSAWNYLRGLLKKLGRQYSPILPAIIVYTKGCSVQTEEESHDWPKAQDTLPGDTPLPVPLALEFLADSLIEQGRLGDAAIVFGELQEHDKMRAGYWEHRRRECLDQ